MFRTTKQILDTAVFVLLGFAAITKAQIPEQAREVAQNELAVLSEKLSGGTDYGVFGGRVTKEEMERAVLGDGFLRKWGMSYEEVSRIDPADVLDYPCDQEYCFPVFIDGRFLGTIDVGDDKEHRGEYKPKTRSYGSPIYERFVEIQKEFPQKEGYSVLLFTAIAQSYAIVYEGSEAVSMTPIENIAARCQGMQERDDSKYPFIPLNVGFQTLQSEAKMKLKLIQKETPEQR